MSRSFYLFYIQINNSVEIIHFNYCYKSEIFVAIKKMYHQNLLVKIGMRYVIYDSLRLYVRE